MPSTYAGQDYDFQIHKIHTIREGKPNPDWQYVKTNKGPFYVLAYCIDGEAVYSMEGVERTVTGGDVLFFTKDSLRTARSSPDRPWHFYSLSFDICFDDEASRRYLDSLESIIHSPNLQLLKSQFSELFHTWTGRRNGYRVHCKSLVMDILYRILKERDKARFNSSQYQAIEKVIALIQSDFTRSYSIEELARYASLSPSHFRLLFKQITGMTSVQYHNHIRLYRARDLLASGECNVTEAALAVGFQDIFYFSRLFKKTLGQSPRSLME